MYYLGSDGDVMCFGPSCVRASWLKETNPEAEQLFSMVAEVFVFWAKSHVRTTLTFVCFVFLISTVQLKLCPKAWNSSPVSTSTEFQMGGTELCGPTWNQQLDISGQQRQDVQGQHLF